MGDGFICWYFFLVVEVVYQVVYGKIYVYIYNYGCKQGSIDVQLYVDYVYQFKDYQ